MTIKRILGTCAATMLAAVSAASMLLAGAGTALAPTPARLTQALSTSNNASAPAVYVNTSTPTTVRYVGTSYVYAPSLAVGTPCSRYAMRAGETTTTVIQAMGNYRTCE